MNVMRQRQVLKEGLLSEELAQSRHVLVVALAPPHAKPERALLRVRLGAWPQVAGGELVRAAPDVAPERIKVIAIVPTDTMSKA